MNRLKLLAAAMLLALPIISACGEPLPPSPPTGSIDGLVSIEGQGIDGVSVTLSNGASASTANGGMFRFDGVEAGAYTVTITNYPDDASFDQTSAAATIATDGETVTVNFPGTYIRTSSIMGTVTVENQGLVGVTVKLTGPSPSETLTDASGQYAFAGLRAGNYTIEISGFDEDDVAFSSTSSAASIAVGESKVVTFQGTYLRTSAIMGQVTADEEPQEGITVTVQGKGEEHSTTTNATGQYSIESLRAGDYSVVITGYDTDDMSFETTSQTVTVGLGETANAPFEGILLRTGGIAGTVTVDGEGPIAGVTVTIQGEGENKTGVTDNAGEYMFDKLPAGDYSVRIVNPNADEYGFDVTSQTVEVELKQTATASFTGILLRTAAIAGAVELRPEDGGAPLANVAVTISGGPRDEQYSLTTRNDGSYRVDRLHAGDYSVEITNPDADEYGFEATSRTVTVDLKETLEVDFSGTLLRTVMAAGMVSVEDFGPLEGVEITISGGLKGLTHTATTDSDGMYELGRLYAGEYSVTMANPNDDEYGFDMPMVDGEEVELRETLKVDFSGILLRTAVIAGTVTVGDDGTPLSGVTLTVSGGPKDESHDATTNAAGEYEVDRLHQGEYTVSLKDFDRVEYGFDPESVGGVDAMRKETEKVNFRGIYLRTAGVSGSVTVPGVGNVDATVTLSMEGEDDRSMETQDGQYGFSGLAAGDYTLTLSGYDAVEYHFNETREFELELNQSKIENFVGKALRTGTIMGSVTVEGDALAGIAVTLIRVISATSGEILGATATDKDGAYSFGPLLAGAYQVMIAGYSDEHDFADGTTWSGAVATDGTSEANFAATIIRTAGVSGMVMVDDEAMAGVTVTLTGGEQPEDGTSMETGDDGMYSFDMLRKGDYMVTITNPDDNSYNFPTTARGVDLAVGQTQDGISFSGTRLKRGSISGQVHAEGEPIEGVTVTLSGDADAEDMTDDNGEYNFPGLAVGEYTVTIDHPGDAYVFTDEELTGEADIVNNDDFVILDFEGKHARNGMVMGKLFIDEGPDPGEYHSSEPMLTRAAWADYLPEAILALIPDVVTGVPVALIGPNLNDPERIGFADADGNYAFSGLVKGEYRVRVALSIPNPDPTGDPIDVGALLAQAGYALGGRNNDVGVPVTVEPGAASQQDFPFMITKQTINVGAVMGVPGKDGATDTRVAGVTLALYATAEDANANRNALGTMKTGAAGTEEKPNPGHGVATFEFDRDDDEGPGGQGNDHLVFAKVTATGHADLDFADNEAIEIQYEATDRESDALAGARLVNVQVNTQWWVKSKSGVPNGDRLLGGWKVVMGNDTIATADSAATVAAKKAKPADHGKATFSTRLTVAEAIAGQSYTFMLDDGKNARQPDGSEEWSQSAALKHEHDHLALPADNMAEDNDLGPIHVTWTTQTLVLGVYREADDTEGFTDYRSLLPRGDHRPEPRVGKQMSIELLARDSRNRLRRYRWGEDKNKDGKPDKDGTSTVGANGLVTFTGIPAGAELTARFHVGSSRKQVDYGYDEIEVFNDDDLEFGSSVGAFGSKSGGGPEVRVCSASEDTSDKWCATFGYQWTTGEFNGKVGSQAGHTVTLEAETGHGATGDDEKTLKGGTVKFSGMHDGVYTATASNNGDYTVDTPKQMGKSVYHDEYAAEKDEDKADSAWVGTRGKASGTWDVTRGGLSIMGFVANDNGDKLIRGDEARAGIQVKLLTDVKFHPATAGKNAGKMRSSKTAQTGETAGNGLYSFTGLDDQTKYWVQVPNGGYINLKAKNPSLHGGTSGIAADVYPALPDESTYEKPEWGTTSVTNPTVSISDGAQTNPTVATLYNFGLVYTDGTVTGAVSNVSGSNANIDVLISNNLNDNEAERATDDEGDFSLGSLMEGTYTAMIEDAGYARPCMSKATGGVPDDDGPVETDGSCTTVAPESISGTLSGRNDYADLGVLYVYSSTASVNDTLADAAAVSVKARIQGNSAGDATDTYHDTITWNATGAGWSREADDSTTANGTSLGTISWRQKTVTFKFTTAGVPTGATVGLSIGTKACAGLTCTLAANATPTDPTATAADRANTIRIKVTAENGYDDHVYTVLISRAAPVGNVLAASAVTGDGTAATGAGTFSSPFTLSTASSTASTLLLLIDQTFLGSADADNLHCPQSVVVKERQTGGTIKAAAQHRTDDCPGERYNLTGIPKTDGKQYLIEITSEDAKKRTYYLNVTRGS